MFTGKKIMFCMILTMVVTTIFCGVAFSAENIVRVLHVAGPEADHLVEYTEEFEKETGIKVSIDITPRDVITERIMRELIEQQGIYDVVMGMGGSLYTTYVNKGQYIPIEDYLSQEEVDQFYGRRVFTDPRSGKMATMPQYHNFEMMFYRKDLLNDPKEQASFRERYGRELTVPRTFQELYEVAEFFTRPPDMYGYLVGGIDWSWACDWLYFLFGQGENVGDEDGNLTLNTPGAIKATEDLIRIVKFGPPGWEAMTFFDGDELMKEGKLFMYQNWTYIWKTFCEEMPDKVGIAPPIGDVEPGVYLSGWLALIPKKAPNPDLAVKFVKWMGGYDYQKNHTMDLMGNLSSRSDVMKDPDVRAAYIGIEELEKALAYAHVPRCTWWDELLGSVYGVFFEAVKGEMTVAEGLNWLQNEKFAGRRAIE